MALTDYLFINIVIIFALIFFFAKIVNVLSVRIMHMKCIVALVSR